MTEKACSTGFKSGEYGGKYSIRQPRDKGKSKVETKLYKTRIYTPKLSTSSDTSSWW